MRKIFSRMALSVCCLGLALLTGCGIFDPDTGDPPPPTQTYFVPSEPGYVLLNLQTAYGNRDTVAYKTLYDSTYTGSSLDLNDLSTIPITYSDELLHISRLARTPGLTAYLSLGPQASWVLLDSDDPSHPDWQVIQITGSNYTISITDGQTTLGAIGEGGTIQEFAFQATPNASSPSGKLWKIIRWKETGRSEPPPES